MILRLPGFTATVAGSFIASDMRRVELDPKVKIWEKQLSDVVQQEGQGEVRYRRRRKSGWSMASAWRGAKFFA